MGRSIIKIMLVSLVLSATGCSSPAESPRNGSLEPLTFCYGAALPTLVAVTQDRRLFEQQGLDVVLKSFPLGANAFEELLAGRCDVANLAETPVVIRSFERDDYRVLASVRSTDNLARIVGRRDRGIRRPSDLKGKKIGIPRGTVPHFFLDQLLARNGLSSQKIQTVFMETDRLAPSLLSGAVDAIATVDPMGYRIAGKLGANAAVLEEPGLSRNFSLVVVRTDYLDSHAQRLQRMLKALQAGQHFCNESPEVVRQVMIRSMNISPNEYEAIWKKYDDRLGLDNALLMTLEEHARWALDKGMVQGRVVPNYLSFINSTLLASVAPEAVRQIR